MGAITDKLLGPPGQPEPGVPFSKAVARKLGLDGPLGTTAHYAQYKSSIPTHLTERENSLYPLLREEMVSKIAEK